VLVRRDGEGALIIGQLSHAWLTGQLARAWGNASFGSVEPREEVVLGAQQHDIGWAKFDLQPGLDPESGLPRSFLQLTVDEHLAIWCGAPDLLMSQSAYAALVVSLHSSSLAELRIRNAPDQAAVLRPHIDEELARQARLCAELSVSDHQQERTRRQVSTWDAVSLALCYAWKPFTISDVPTADGHATIELADRKDGTLTLDPWPFSSQQVEVQCEARRLEHHYETETSMREALRRAIPVKLNFVLIAS
jgi:hypothetical protein